MTEAVTLTPLTDVTLWHLRGPNAVATATTAGIELAPDWFRHVDISGGGFAAQLGAREVYVLDRGADGAWSSALQEAAQAGTWIFPRQDAIFTLNEPGWRQLLLAVCAHEFEQNEAGDFLMTNMAGVGCWFALPHKDGDPVTVGCDPSYRQYLMATLTDVLADQIAENRGKAHDA